MFSRGHFYSLLTVAFMITLTSVLSIPVMRMRLCIASNDPYRLQSQCVLCHNKRFVKTVRQCTGGTYLPANVSVEEGFCMIKQCRSQMPLIPPQPYNTMGSNVNLNTVTTDNLYSGYESSTDYQYQLPKPVRVRPPAVLHIGKPVRPGLLTGRPLLFGKRSIDSKTNGENHPKICSTQNKCLRKQLIPVSVNKQFKKTITNTSIQTTKPFK